MADKRIDIRFLSARDVDELSLSPADVLESVEAALRAQGEGEVVLEPREHLVPDPALDERRIWLVIQWGRPVAGTALETELAGLPFGGAASDPVPALAGRPISAIR